ncbi:MAG: hypothetical protein D3924_10160 [Candidatus Electrothrix sp. AR4]|nr:hypothetical protein [Candidatus Electrothrix sp. AR4]
MPVVKQKKYSKKKLMPGVSRSMHLFMAPLIWTIVGILLMVRGLGWIGFRITCWLLLVAVFVGTVKSVTILDRSAKKTLHRIMGMRDKTCIGAVYPWKTWLLVVLMMSSGIALRSLTEPGLFLGTVYFAVGWGLLLSSRHGWAQWLLRGHHD